MAKPPVEAVKNAIYETSLTDNQWLILEQMIPKPCKRGRPPTDRRWIVDAILYVTEGGIQWRLLAVGFPPRKTVYHVFRKWTRDNTWESINARLRALVREKAGKQCRPTAAILDSQSVKSDAHGGAMGYDAAKCVKGRKRHLLIDTLGLVLGVLVTPANIPEREGAQLLLGQVLAWFSCLRIRWVDGGYTGDIFANWVRSMLPNLKVEVVKRSDDVRGFRVLPQRWVVERTFGWLMRSRRLVRDYATKETHAEAFV